MKRKWLGPGLAACCAVLALFFSFHRSGEGKLLLVQDAFDPMAKILEPHAGQNMERLNPYQLGQLLPGLNGAALVFGTQARRYEEAGAAGSYLPLYRTAIVIALNRRSRSAGAVTGWRTLLESKAVVLPPHHGTEGGRLAAIALARGLGAAEGDLKPAIAAYASLKRQNRLNSQDQYHSREYWAMFDPRRLAEHDAVILWDYQAAALQRLDPHWKVIIPEEGPFVVDCGLVFAGGGETTAKLRGVKAYLLSAAGQRALSEAGFSAPAGRVDLAAWDRARLTFNPSFRRSVLSVKRLGPASLQERLLLQCITLLLFVIAAQRILRRIPAGLYRTTSLYSMLLILLWMLTGLAKALAPTPELTRYLWFATYIPRHALPLCWLLMCYVNKNGRLPPRQGPTALSLGALLLTAFVWTNDLHRSVFVYTTPEPARWANEYSNGWGYYLSLAWVIALSLSGLVLLLDRKQGRRQQRRLLYAALFFVALLGYQSLYLAGVAPIIDLDIPTTVSALILVFILAAQRERFMGASLLHLPLFQNSPHAISVQDRAGQAVYRNRVMEGLRVSEAGQPAPLHLSAAAAAVTVHCGERIFKPHRYHLDRGSALLLEDVTELKRLEGSLQEAHHKLSALRGLLIRQAKETRSLTSRLEQERYSLQMEALFKEKVEDVRNELRRVQGSAAGAPRRELLRRTRFLLSISQQRLRFIIHSLDFYPRLPLQLVEGYAARVIEEGRRTGLDSVFTAAVNGFCCCPRLAAVLLESADRICLHAFDRPGASLICRLETGAEGLTLSALLSRESGACRTEEAVIPPALAAAAHRLGGQFLQKSVEEGLQIRLTFDFEEGRDDLVQHTGCS